MNNLMDLYEDKQKKLGRNLEECEKDFLKWVYERYENEVAEDQLMKKNELC